jgi:hypothetical protein
VAAYNVQFISTDVVKQGDRLSKLCEVMALLDAHVIGPQEIADRAAKRFAVECRSRPEDSPILNVRE